MRRSVYAGFAAVLVAALLTGCATSPKEPNVEDDLDVYGAKQIAQEMEQELAAFIPQENIVASAQLAEGVLLSCEGDRTFRWTGHTYVQLTGDPDTEPIVDAVAEEFSERESFAAERDVTDDGVPRVRVRGPGASSYSMALSVDHTQMEIFSFSPCFHLPEDMSHRAKY
jgi:hypothetical protein